MRCDFRALERWTAMSATYVYTTAAHVEAGRRSRLKSWTSKSPHAVVRNRTDFLYSRPSLSCLEERLNRQRDSLHARAICNRHEQRVITSTIPVERRLGQERAHSRIDGTEVGGVEVTTSMVALRMRRVSRERSSVISLSHLKWDSSRNTLE
jgi:hypothetical protein